MKASPAALHAEHSFFIHFLTLAFKAAQDHLNARLAEAMR
jgi:hypothetical protein